MDWDIINNELIDWGVAVVGDGVLPPEYADATRYTDDIVISRNIFRSSRRDRNYSIFLDDSEGNQGGSSYIWIQNNMIHQQPGSKGVHTDRAGQYRGTASPMSGCSTTPSSERLMTRFESLILGLTSDSRGFA